MVKRFVKALVVAVYRCLTHLIPVKKGLVVFDSFMGKSYSGSVRAVYEWMRDNKPDKPYVPVWVFTREALRKGLPGMPDCRISSATVCIRHDLPQRRTPVITLIMPVS